ncbi:hypothetical protein [Nocardia sp. BMG51109]|uniref:hypothetical protein n=1 Tax=Nocardia sp. BMG51109 TaxID=1056816 RepID=UPI0004641BCA|nr:hypothetical protein [Nocardia sp. BMG51109]
MIVSSGIRMLSGDPEDWIVITDPVVRYRPDRVKGCRYHITTSVPKAGNDSGSGVPPAPGTGR